MMTPPQEQATTVRAYVRRTFGPISDVVTAAEIPMPVIGDDQVLVRVHASSVNPADWHFVTGTPYLVRLREGFSKPKRPAIGLDAAGTVEAIGPNASRFRVGDAVFGEVIGAYADYLSAAEDKLAVKPDNVSFEQAAAVPVAAVTALQGLRDKGKVLPGQKVLIIGASGGVGTFAVQIAKALGAHVTAVCSTKHVETVKSIGADVIVDYTREDFSRADQSYDVIFDGVGSTSLAGIRSVLNRNGTYVLVGGPKRKWVGPLPRLMRALAYFPMFGRKATALIADATHADLTTLATMIKNGEVTPVIDRQYELTEIVDALTYLEEGHSQGKTVIRVLKEETI